VEYLARRLPRIVLPVAVDYGVRIRVLVICISLLVRLFVDELMGSSWVIKWRRHRPRRRLPGSHLAGIGLWILLKWGLYDSNVKVFVFVSNQRAALNNRLLHIIHNL
jgi:hypothetical protein